MPDDHAPVVARGLRIDITPRLFVPPYPCRSWVFDRVDDMYQAVCASSDGAARLAAGGLLAGQEENPTLTQVSYGVGQTPYTEPAPAQRMGVYEGGILSPPRLTRQSAHVSSLFDHRVEITASRVCENWDAFKNGTQT